MPRPVIPHVLLTGTVDGVTTTRRVPVELLQSGAPYPVQRTPLEPFPDAIVLGDSALRDDHRQAQIVLADFSGGVGAHEADELQALTSVNWSTADTRHPGLAVCRPQTTRLGASTLAAGGASTAQDIVYLGFTNALLVSTTSGSADSYYYDPADDTWKVLTNYRFAGVVKQGGYAFAWGRDNLGNQVVWRSSNGTAWSSIATTGIATAQCLLLGFHDNRLCLLNSETSNAARLYYSTNYNDAVGSITWTSGGAINGNSGEAYVRLFVWQYPPDRETEALWCLTDRALWYYNDTANTWSRHDFWHYDGGAATQRWAATWQRTGALFVTTQTESEHLRVYSSSTTELAVGPNVRGGLPDARLGAISCMEGNDHVLVAWAAKPSWSTNSKGWVMMMDEARQWHHLWSDATEKVIAGCLGPNYAYSLMQSGKVYRTDLRDEAATPLHAVAADGGATPDYDDAATQYIVTPWYYGGTKYLRKLATYATLDVRKRETGALNLPGLPADATFTVDYQVDGVGEVDDTWTALISVDDTLDNLVHQAFTRTLNSVSVNGVPWQRIRFRFGFTRGTDASATPILAAFVLHFLRRAKRRYRSVVRVDLRDGAPAFAGKSRRYGGYSAAALRAWLEALGEQEDGDGTTQPLVQFAYGGYGRTTHPSRRGPTLADMVLTPVDDVTSGAGRYSLTFLDQTVPA